MNSNYKDELFLLNLEQFEKYKDLIPPCNIGNDKDDVQDTWWLQTAADNEKVYLVDNDGNINTEEPSVKWDDMIIRIACYIPECKEIDGLKAGDIFTYGIEVEGDQIYNIDWVLLDEESRLSLLTYWWPTEYNKPYPDFTFDSKSNNYMGSEIRKRLNTGFHKGFYRSRVEQTVFKITNELMSKYSKEMTLEQMEGVCEELLEIAKSIRPRADKTKKYYDKNGRRIRNGDILHFDFIESGSANPVVEKNQDLGIIDYHINWEDNEFISLSTVDLSNAVTKTVKEWEKEDEN